MKRENRLRHSAEISRVRRTGERVHSPFATLYYTQRIADDSAKETLPSVSRFCFVVSKRVGNAVVRNRTKRRLRENVRLLLGAARIVDGWDCVIIAKPAVLESTATQLEAAVSRMLKKAQLLIPEQVSD